MQLMEELLTKPQLKERFNDWATVEEATPLLKKPRNRGHVDGAAVRRAFDGGADGGLTQPHLQEPQLR